MTTDDFIAIVEAMVNLRTQRDTAITERDCARAEVERLRTELIAERMAEVERGAGL